MSDRGGCISLRSVSVLGFDLCPRGTPFFEHFAAQRLHCFSGQVTMGLKQSILAIRAELSPRTRAITAAATIGCVMFVFEAAKQALYPTPSIWTSHAITILCTTLAGGAVTFAALKYGTKVALRQSEIQYRLLFDSNPLPMWVLDRKTLKFLAVNEAASRQYGFSSQEFLTMTIADIGPEEDIPDLSEATVKTFADFRKRLFGDIGRRTAQSWMSRLSAMI
jgi:PAS domain-containing protein